MLNEVLAGPSDADADADANTDADADAVAVADADVDVDPMSTLPRFCSASPTTALTTDIVPRSQTVNSFGNCKSQSKFENRTQVENRAKFCQREFNVNYAKVVCVRIDKSIKNRQTDLVSFGKQNIKEILIYSSYF